MLQMSEVIRKLFEGAMLHIKPLSNNYKYE